MTTRCSGSSTHSSSTAPLIDELNADRALTVLTSAVRDAANGGEFATAVEERYKLEPHILSGDDEARLTFLGATSERDPDDETPTLVIDIGGGSTELVIGRGRKAEFHVSNQAGVVRQTERHITDDPPPESDLEKLAADVDEILRRGVPEEHRRAVRRAIGVAGTATSLGAIAQRLDPYDPAKVHGYVLRRHRAGRDPSTPGGDDARAAQKRCPGSTPLERPRSSPAS